MGFDSNDSDIDITAGALDEVSSSDDEAVITNSPGAQTAVGSSAKKRVVVASDVLALDESEWGNTNEEIILVRKASANCSSVNCVDTNSVSGIHHIH